MKFSAIFVISAIIGCTVSIKANSQNSPERLVSSNYYTFDDPVMQDHGTQITNGYSALPDTDRSFVYVTNSPKQEQNDKKYILNGILIGSVLGATTGGTIAYVSYEECTDTGLFGCFIHFSRGESTGMGAVLGLLMGAVAGGITGAIVKAEKRKRLQVSYQSRRIQMPDSKPVYAHGITMKYRFN